MTGRGPHRSSGAFGCLGGGAASPAAIRSRSVRTWDDRPDGAPTYRGRVTGWKLSGAQQAVNVVAAVMAGQPRDDVRVALDIWLERFGGELAEPVHADVVGAISRGSAMVVLGQPGPWAAVPAR